MTPLYYQLKAEETRLSTLIAEKERKVAAAPDTMLKMAFDGEKPRYYQKNGKDDKWTYIHVNERAIAEKLAQADYDRKILSVLKKKLLGVRSLLKMQIEQTEENVFWKLHPGRQELIIPTMPVVERTLKAWEERTYDGKPIDGCKTEIYTERGERVRSKSEKIIADKLYQMGIPYKYEYPVDFGYYTGYVDFLVLNKYTNRTFYYEHFGMMDDDSYKNDVARRIRDYEQIGVFPGGGLVMTFESSVCSISVQELEYLCRKHFLAGQPILPTEHGY